MHTGLSHLAALVCATAVGFTGFGAKAAPDDPSNDDRPGRSGSALHWRSEWTEFQDWEYIVIAGSVTTNVISAIIGPQKPSLFPTPPGFDESFRDFLRPSSLGNRQLARDLSDVLVTVVSTYPTVGDGFINAAWYRQSPEVAKQLIWMNLEVAAVTAALTSVTKSVVGRERPFGRTCGTELSEDTSDCEGRGRFASHFSGHTSASFAAASATCMHHQYLPLWGDTPSWVPCVVGYSAAAATGLLRIAADVHYLTDVGVGAVVGTGVGLLIPWLHYRPGGTAARDSDSVLGWMQRHQVSVVPAPGGVSISGAF